MCSECLHVRALANNNSKSEHSVLLFVYMCMQVTYAALDAHCLTQIFAEMHKRHTVSGMSSSQWWLHYC
jgi:hypothetical protein